MRIFSIHSGWLWISLVAVVHLSACKKEILGPSPGVSRIVPKAVCQQQLDTEVTIFGDKMSPMPFDTLMDDPKLQLPTVELLQTQDIDGQPSSSGAVTIPDDPEHPEESRVTWRSEGEMSFEVFPNLALNTGLHTVSVTNGNGANTTLPSSLLAVPPPELTELVPDLLCADQDSDLSLQGDFFIRLDSLEPTVEFTVSSTTTSVATRPTAALGTCRLLPGDSGAEACEQLDITVPDGTLGTGGSSFVNFSMSTCTTRRASLVPPRS